MRGSSFRSTLARLGLGVTLLGFALPAGAQGEAAASASAAAASAAAADADTPPDPRTARVRALLEGSLDPKVSAQSLFDVPLDDEAALRIEAARVRVLLRAIDEAAPGSADEPTDANGLRADLRTVDPGLWRKRLELDRARLDFYSLPAERRAELLREHAARRSAAQPSGEDQERLASESEAERKRALDAANAAPSEAERLVSEEVARLIALDSRVRVFRDHLGRERDQIAARRDTVLGWQRRVRDAQAAGPSDADGTYDALRRALRTTRDDLSAGLDALVDERSEVPDLGPDPLADLPPDVATESVRARRAALQRRITEARSEENALREERVSALLDEMSTLNRERLGLLPSLSLDERDAITGFTSAGLDQARSEARHLMLILRYHQHVARAWLTTLRDGGRAMSPWKAAAVVLPLILAIAAFTWVRRRTQRFLEWADSRLASADRTERRTFPSLGRRIVRIGLKIHRPLEWIGFSVALHWLLPSGVRNLLEVELLFSAIGFALAGALIVNTIDAFAAGGAATLIPLDEGESGRLRLRSLRLVGRTVVVFALILVLSARLVGEGTIYSWVFSTCWFAAFPLFLLLVRWWRGTVFTRLDRIRKKTPLETWILANRSGWKSFVAAMLGAVLLFGTGTIKLLRNWLSSFDLARRVHAYLFKREIERIGEGHPRAALAPLPAPMLEQLHPEREHGRWVPCPSDELREGLVRRATAGHGGLVAIVGARGMGKSSLLDAVAERVETAAVLRCGAQTVLADLRAAAHGPGSEATTGSARPIVMIDDVQTLVEPRIGGLAKFDDFIAFARSQGEGVVWVFGIDASVWPLLKRARDARPMFDEIHVLSPWDERQLGALLGRRCEDAGISPTFEDLLDRLPPGADDIDRQDALKAKRAGYERMLWDHVGGNPGLALEVFRVSLGRDDAGVVHVRPLQVPDMTRLERLPDTSLFVLRAVLQLAPTTVEAVSQATRLRREEVLQDFQYGKTQGFYDEKAGRVVVAWPWLRAVMRLLERHHLLGTP